jgi:phosphoserine aminotransferase
MRPVSFAPGPTELHPAVRAELRSVAGDGYLSESHRSGAVRREVSRLDEALRALLGIPDGYRVLLLGSATEAMERIVEGVRPAPSFHLVQGAFGRRFRDIAENAGVAVEMLEVPDGSSFRAHDVTLPPGAELLAMTQNETSTGARIPPSEVALLAARARAAGALVAADLVTGWPTEPVNPAWLDAGFLSVQKGFGLPPGLGILVASPALVERARELRGQGIPVGGWMHLPALADAADRNETVATPNTLAIRLLARVAEAYLGEGGQAALSGRAERGFERWWEAIKALDALGGVRLTPFVPDRELRSRTVAVVAVQGADRIREALQSRGLIVGDGYGPWKSRHLRVAHFPVQTPEMQGRLLDALAGVVSAFEPPSGSAT